MIKLSLLLYLYAFSRALLVLGLRFDPELVDYNLNQNKQAVNPLDYTGIWQNHRFNPSPENWRFPFYSFFLDKFANGDPSNDDINGTQFEHDPLQTQLRHGGDLQGLVDSLDYIQGMGVKGIYIVGTPFINFPWGYDGYSPLDTTILDQHFGTIQTWQSAITEIHKRGMYIVLDNTLATMGNLISAIGFENTSTPFDLNEHNDIYTDPQRQYHDFSFSNTKNKTCTYPKFWADDGLPVGKDVTDQLKSCFDSEFDQYGDIEAFGVFPNWQRQLAKFASVQDRLREWDPRVRSKIDHLTCLLIQQLDIDGLRIDKAIQSTVDALAGFSQSIRQCAKKVGKDNFFVAGEIAGSNTYGTLYIGRGRQANMKAKTLVDGINAGQSRNQSEFLREKGNNGLDAAAFHYSIYHTLERFLGLDGNLEDGFDLPENFVDAWNQMIITNDLANQNTGIFDPRHMMGATNQDNFRWPGIHLGTERSLMASYITTLLMPGIPLVFAGEEQAFYTLDNTAGNYLFGRQAMTSTLASEIHSCYKVGTTLFNNFPLESALHGCEDPGNALDHRDPSHPVRNILKSMFQMRQNYASLNDGWFLQPLSNQTHFVQFPGSKFAATELGIWSVLRGHFAGSQDLSTVNELGNQPIWMVYHNNNKTTTYNFDCSNNDTALISALDTGATAKNLFYPHDEIVLEKGPKKLGIYGSEKFNGCLKQLTLAPYEFRAYVPKGNFTAISPMITKFVPGHDARLTSTVSAGQQEDVEIEFHFSAAMNCDSVTSNLKITSTTEDGTTPKVVKNSVECLTVPPQHLVHFVGNIPTTWTYKAKLTGVSNGVHELTLTNVTAQNGGGSTGSTDHFLFRTGQSDNPVVFPKNASYRTDLLSQDSSGGLVLTHTAAGADSFRYSTNWGSSYSKWIPYTGKKTTVTLQPFSGTSRQKWSGEHVIVQYFSRLSGSSDYVQHGDVNHSPRRFPHLFLMGAFNEFGLDQGLPNDFSQESNGSWIFNFMTEWPARVQINQWGIDPSGQPDQSQVFGDIDGDNVLDRIPPQSLAPALINITIGPPSPFLAWKLSLDDATLKFAVVPVGNRWLQLIMFVIMAVIPTLTAAASIWVYTIGFYQVKFNKIGVSKGMAFLKTPFWRRNAQYQPIDPTSHEMERPIAGGAAAGLTKPRKTILIATMEYDIEDWAVKVKIGGLGVMAQLMGKNLAHQNLIWVIPCVGGIDYPEDPDGEAEPMEVQILGNPYEVKVRYHQLRNITYVLLDAPVFRAQSKSEPYPARMDDLDSAIYYSAWNQCVALTTKRFPIDLYHINDYHGSLAPVYLLPETIPVCLSLHNAEFQGLWPMRTPQEVEEICSVYNLDIEVIKEYVQFGEVFNLLHAAASYIRIHQKGFGAVGVSNKYGKRSWARYPIFWGLSKIGTLPNPDPSDTAEWSENAPVEKFVIDEEFERKRGELKRQAQEWAGLIQNPNAELLVFVGRWSMQKGVDLIADVMPAVLQENENVQLICVGPVIDLYGKFAALKLEVIMKKFPGRVFSKPEFTALPPFIFSGAEFALIPSRDEPFGLVAVEFGRKGALGIGARVGGLGQMPGWWFTVESTTTSHMLHQFKAAIKEALDSKPKIRREMRARSAKQRFPVAQWVQSLERLQSQAIAIHEKEHKGRWSKSGSSIRPMSSYSTLSLPYDLASGAPSPSNSPPRSRRVSAAGPFLVPGENQSRNRTPSPMRRVEPPPPTSGLGRSLSLGVRNGPGSVRGRGRRAGAAAGENRPVSTIQEYDDEESSEDDDQSINEFYISVEEAEFARTRVIMDDALNPVSTRPESRPDSRRSSTSGGHPDSPPQDAETGLLDAPRPASTLLSPGLYSQKRNSSALSLDLVVGDKKDYQLQHVDPTFNDTKGEYYHEFESMLASLDAKNSDNDLAIETFLEKSEKEWHKRFLAARLSRGRGDSVSSDHDRRSSIYLGRKGDRSSSVTKGFEKDDEFEVLLGRNYKRPTGLRRILQYRVGDWPLYSLLLALGQIVAASAYQITLISGVVGLDKERFYITVSIYLATSILWWLMFRTVKSVYVLSLPFLFYGLAFLTLALAPVFHNMTSRMWLVNVATGSYAIASSSGSLFFSLNFGDEGGSPIKSWVFRCCVIQGTQQIYVCALWFFGDYLSKLTSQGRHNIGIINNASFGTTTAILAPIAVVFFSVGLILLFGLPNYYRQAPGKVPSFYISLFRRKTVIWFFVTVIIQNYFLSEPYGRNWQYLFASNHATTWEIVLLIFFFFIFIWGFLLFIFGQLSKTHSWILPIFGIGLGAPRWAQILWSCSNIGMYVPWVGSPLASALVGRSLWLWLGVLDALQGVGFGMILLQTLTRIHMAATLIALQIIGAAITMVAQATQQNAVGTTFPDFSAGVLPGLAQPWFWVGLTLQLVICVGFFTFFRKEQLSKP